MNACDSKAASEVAVCLRKWQSEWNDLTVAHLALKSDKELDPLLHKVDQEIQALNNILYSGTSDNSWSAESLANTLKSIRKIIKKTLSRTLRNSNKNASLKPLYPEVNA